MRLCVILPDESILILEDVKEISDAGQIREAALQAMEDAGDPVDYVKAADCIIAVDAGKYIKL